MLLLSFLKRICKKSGEELSIEDIAKVREILGTSRVISEFDRERRPKTGELTYTSIDMIVMMVYVEVKKTTFGGAIVDLNDVGGQERLAALGMPCKRGIRRCPAKSTMSVFVNRIWPKLEPELSKEMTEAIMKDLEAILLTCDSTPLEASRYSDCDYHPHYDIRMDKDHIIMANGHPIYHVHSRGNASDYTEFMNMMEDVQAISPNRVRGFATDGAYHGFTAYAKVFEKTGKVMATNQGEDAVYHPDAEWKDIEKAYNKFWKWADFKPAKYVCPRDKLMYLIRHGKEELVGQFLHNLDFMRGRRIKDKWAKERHVCETVHFQAKRWIRFDVRGLRRKTVKNRVSLRFFIVQLLDSMFVETA